MDGTGATIVPIPWQMARCEDTYIPDSASENSIINF
jgi:hypothetical protein